LKVKPECAVCLVKRALKEAQLASSNEEHALAAMKEILRMLGKEFNENAVPAILGSKRDEIIKKITGCIDPYKDLKKEANKSGKLVAENIDKQISEIKDEYERFRKAVLAAIVGNIMEFFVLNHKYTLKDVEYLINRAEEDLVIDDIAKAFEIVKKKCNILYLMDNAGEIFLDKILIRELKKLGCKVIVVVKEKPILNDATLEDAECSKVTEIADKVVTPGYNGVGLVLEKCSEDFLKEVERTDLIIAKGMGYYETLTEYKFNQPIFHMFRTKCVSVANDVGVPQDRNVAWIKLN